MYELAITHDHSPGNHDVLDLFGKPLRVLVRRPINHLHRVEHRDVSIAHLLEGSQDIRTVQEIARDLE